MAKRNEVVFTGSVSWAQNEDAAKTIDINVPSLAPDEGEQYLLSIKNGSAAVNLTVSIANLITFTSSPEAADIVSDILVCTSSAIGKVVTGFPLGSGGRLKFTKSSVTAPAFTAYVELRRA